MSNRLVGVYWGARAESKGSSAQRILNFKNSISELSPLFTHWYKKTPTRKSKLVEIERYEDIVKELKTINNSISNKPMNELGFSFAAWNGRTDESAISLSISCGATSEHVKNSLAFTLYKGNDIALMLLRSVLESAVLAFDPDVGVIISSETPTSNGVPIWESPAPIKYRRNIGYEVNE